MQAAVNRLTLDYGPRFTVLLWQVSWLIRSVAV